MAYPFKKLAFVISPIGGQGDEATRNRRGEFANAVFNQVIDPACRRLAKEHGLDVVAVRGDHGRDQQDIMVRILDGIVNHEFTIALLSEADEQHYNPNVYWELGAAHALGRPVLLLKRQDGQDLPFDIEQLKMQVIHFTDRHLYAGPDYLDPLGEGGPAAELADRLLALATTPGGTHERPFRQPRSDVYGQIGARERFKEYDFKELSKIVLSAQREVWLCGTSLLFFAEEGNNKYFMPDRDTGELVNPANFITLLAYLISTGVDVKIMMTAENHPVIPFLLHQQGDKDGNGIDDAVDTVNKEIRRARNLWNAFAKGAAESVRLGSEIGANPPSVQPGTVEVIELRKGAAFNRILLTDQLAILSPNFVHTIYNTGPCLEAKAGSVGYRWIRDELEFLANQNRHLRDWPAARAPQPAGEAVPLSVAPLAVQQSPKWFWPFGRKAG